MKAIVCELCGSNDIVKTDGLFVCQYCGTKYTLEEARKLMLEGPIEVQGTVKVDRSSETVNILKNADATYEDGNYEEAFALFSKVISLDPENAHAILYRAMSSAWQSSVKDCRIGEINKGASRAFKIMHKKWGDSKDFFEFATDALLEIVRVINAIEGMYISYYNKAMPVNYSITGALATSGISDQVSDTMHNGIKDCCIVAHNMVNYIITVVEDYSEADQKFWDTMEIFPENCCTYRNNAKMFPNPEDQELLEKILKLREKGEYDRKVKRKAAMEKH